MAPSNAPLDEAALRARTIRIVVQLTLLVLLFVWCFQIVRPFITPVVWGAVLAVAVHSPYAKLRRVLGDRAGLAAVLLVGLALFAVIGPTLALTASLVETTAGLSEELHQGRLEVPPPPERVRDWPVVGGAVYETWLGASENLESALLRARPQLETVGLWLLSTAGSTGRGILLFVIAIVIAGAFLARAESTTGAVRRVTLALAGPRGPALVDLAGATIRGVTKGILGVAAIQGLLAGLGMLAVGVPAAGLWTLLVLILAVIQLPPMLVLLPVVLYVFSVESTTVAVLFAVWSLLAGSCDTFLKPLLMGRGLELPTLVIFIGAIGGFMLEGIIGLFVGAVVLALGYTLLVTWVDEAQQRAGA
jgi:predicted PurR-regulated permease PerM